MNAVRIAIVDDHPVFRHGLRALLASIPDMEVVAEADNGEQAVRIAASAKPDVILMDLHLPGISGVEASRRVAEEAPDIHVIVLTMFEDDNSLFAAMRAGAKGYLVKGADQDEILRAIRAVASGGAVFGPAIAKRLRAHFAAPSLNLSRQPFAQLSEREHDVLELLAQGMDNTTIGRRLGISPKTVRNHTSNIFTKLQVSDRGQAIIAAREAGLGDPPSASPP